MKIFGFERQGINLKGQSLAQIQGTFILMAPNVKTFYLGIHIDVGLRRNRAILGLQARVDHHGQTRTESGNSRQESALGHFKSHVPALGLETTSDMIGLGVGIPERKFIVQRQPVRKRYNLNGSQVGFGLKLGVIVDGVDFQFGIFIQPVNRNAGPGPAVQAVVVGINYGCAQLEFHFIHITGVVAGKGDCKGEISVIGIFIDHLDPADVTAEFDRVIAVAVPAMNLADIGLHIHFRHRQIIQFNGIAVEQLLHPHVIRSRRQLIGAAAGYPGGKTVLAALHVMLEQFGRVVRSVEPHLRHTVLAVGFNNDTGIERNIKFGPVHITNLVNIMQLNRTVGRNDRSLGGGVVGAVLVVFIRIKAHGETFVLTLTGHACLVIPGAVDNFHINDAVFEIAGKRIAIRNALLIFAHQRRLVTNGDIGGGYSFEL